MIFIIIPAVIFVFGTIIAYFLFIYKLSSPQDSYQESIESLDKLVLERRNILKEIAVFVLGLVDPLYYQELNKQVTELKEQLAAKKLKIQTVENEINKTETNLKDVAEVNQELEMSQIDSQKEIDLLKAQETDISNQNAWYKQELQNVVKNVSESLAKIEGSKSLIDNLSTQTAKADQKARYFQSEIELLNKKYLEIKNQYDALDIEYAQLYEDGGE